VGARAETYTKRGIEISPNNNPGHRPSPFICTYGARSNEEIQSPNRRARSPLRRPDTQLKATIPDSITDSHGGHRTLSLGIPRESAISGCGEFDSDQEGHGEVLVARIRAIYRPEASHADAGRAEESQEPARATSGCFGVGDPTFHDDSFLKE
jgi:hypothetical protein